MSTPEHTGSRSDPRWVRITLVVAALGVIGVLIVVPLVAVFVEAFAGGVGAYWQTLTHDEDTLAAIRLTLTVAPDIGAPVTASKTWPATVPWGPTSHTRKDPMRVSHAYGFAVCVPAVKYAFVYQNVQSSTGSTDRALYGPGP